MKENIKYSLVVPCYNEEKNISLILERFAELATVNDNFEAIIVDNGSTDNTPYVLRELMAKYPFARSIRVEVNQGYGFGIVSGLRATKGEAIGWTHGDMQTDPMDFLKAIYLYENQSESNRCFIKGRRFGRTIGDTFFTLGMSIFETLLLGCLLWDINAQPNLFSRSFFYKLEELPNDFSLDLFMYYMAKRNGLKVQRFPVSFKKRIYGYSNWNINWRAKIKFIKQTIGYSLKLRKKIDHETKAHCSPG